MSKQKKITIDGQELNLHDGNLKLGVTLEISDISNLSVSKNSKSTTLTVPGSANNKKILRFPEDWNAADPIDQSEKPIATADIEGTEAFRGYAKVEDATTEKGITDYKLRLIGDNGDWRERIKDKKISDLDYSSDNHVFNKSTVEASWVISPARNYVYDLIDRGKFTSRPGILGNFNSSGASTAPKARNPGEHINIMDMYPAISFVSIFKKAFAAIGYKIVGNFIDGAFFSKLYFPFINKSFKHPDAWMDDKRFKAVQQSPSGTYYAFTKNFSQKNLLFPINLSNDSTGDGSDPLNLFEIRNENIIYTGQFTFNIPYSGQNYKTFKAPNRCGYKFRYWIDFSRVGGTPLSGSTHFNLMKKKKGVPTKQPIHSYSVPFNMIAGRVEEETAFIQLEQDDIVWIEIDMSYGTTNAATTLFIYNHNPGAGKYCFLELIDCDASPIVSEGDPITMNANLPETSQLDFIQGVKDLFNLYFYADVKTRAIYIEPRDNFYSGTTINWSSKLDKNKPIEIRYIGDSYTKRLRYKYKEDSADKFIQDWNKENDDSFGSHTQSLENVFLKDETTDYQNKIFAATWMESPPLPLVGLKTVKLARMWSDVSQPPHSTAFLPRILYYDGLQNLPSTDYWHLLAKKQGGISSGELFLFEQIKYPRFYSYGENAGEYNLLYEDMGLARGLFHRYYRNTHKVIDDSRLVIPSFNLTDPDIANFDFRNPIYVEEEGNGSYFIVQKIDGFDTDSKESVMVELIKVIGTSPLIELTAPITRGNQPHHRGAMRVDKSADGHDVVIVAGTELVRIDKNTGDIRTKGGFVYTRVDDIIVPVMYTDEENNLRNVIKSEE